MCWRIDCRWCTAGSCGRPLSLSSVSPSRLPSAVPAVDHGHGPDQGRPNMIRSLNSVGFFFLGIPNAFPIMKLEPCASSVGAFFFCKTDSSLYHRREKLAINVHSRTVPSYLHLTIGYQEPQRGGDQGPRRPELADVGLRRFQVPLDVRGEWSTTLQYIFT